jgi:tetratricopeptide (TPR) repeat protein
MRWSMVVLVLSMSAAERTDACGGGFPPYRLLPRHKTMMTMPDGTFRIEVVHGLIDVDGKPAPLPAACVGMNPTDLAFCLGEAARPLLGRDDDTAIRWYAQQAAIEATLDEEHESGAASLLLVGRQLLRDPARMLRQWHRPAVQRLASLTIWSRSHVDFVDSYEEQTSTAVAPLKAIEQHGGRNNAPAWLAAGAYRLGQFGMAESLLGLASTDAIDPNSWQRNSYIGHWVRSKLLLRRGRAEDAKRELQHAERAAPPGVQSSWESDEGSVYDPVQRIRSERAIYELQQGQPVAAMSTLWPNAAVQWEDVAYVAERLLTIEQLQTFVQQLSLDDKMAGKPSPAARLNALLGRRLMRAGRYDEALPHLSAHIEPARRYATARKAAERATHPLDRAAALFEAHLVLAEPAHGLHVIGTEVGPDWVVYEGNNIGPSLDDEDVFPSFDAEDDWRPRYHKEMMEERSHDARWLGPHERELSAQARPSLLRYHYRYVASELAEQAALLVHPRSQAYAALMCHAADTIHTIHIGRRDQVYRAFLNNGALMENPPWDYFGENCGKPNFDRLRDANWMPKTLAERQRLAHEEKWALRWRLVHATVMMAALVAAMIVGRNIMQARHPSKTVAT